MDLCNISDSPLHSNQTQPVENNRQLCKSARAWKTDIKANHKPGDLEHSAFSNFLNTIMMSSRSSCGELAATPNSYPALGVQEVATIDKIAGNG